MGDMIDSAVGAILTIPDTALKDIKKAEEAIESLERTSKKAADNIRNHWDSIATSGMEVFVQKIREATTKLEGISAPKVNTQPLEQSMNNAAGTVRNNAQQISQSLQSISRLNIDTTSIKSIQESVDAAGIKFHQLEEYVKKLEQGRSYTSVPESPEAIAYNNAIEKLKQFIALRKKSEEQLATKRQKEADTYYLNEQKRLLDRILQLRKDIANVNMSVQRGTITGKEDMSKDIAQLAQLKKELQDTGREYRNLQTSKSEGLSEDAATKAAIQSQNARNQGLRQEKKERDELNKAIVRGNELVAQGQQGKTRLGSGEEAAVQRQLNSDYKSMIKILREVGELKAKAAEQGRSLNQQEINLVTQLAQRYGIYKDDVNRVANAYANMGRAAAENFAKDRSEQLARNAILLADAQEKAAQAAQKSGLALRDTTSIKTELDAVNKKIIEEWANYNKLKNEIAEAKVKLDEFKNANKTWGRGNDAVLELDRMRQRIAELQNLMATATPGSNIYKKYEYELNLLGKKYGELSEKVNTYRTLVQQADESTRLDSAKREITALEDKFIALNKKLRETQRVNDAVNSEMAKGSTASGLAKEYANLTKRLQEVNKAMNDYLAAGGSQRSTAYQSLESEFMRITARRKEIEKADIAEVNQYRQAMTLQSNQQELSAFIQNEAQKTAEAKRAAEQQSQERMAAYQRFLNTYQGAMAAVNKLESGTRGGNWANTYENRERVIKNLEAAIKSLDKADADYKNKLDALTAALQRLKNAQKEVTDAMKPSKPMVSATDAINAAKSATSLKELQQAYTQLKAVMDSTDPKSKDWELMNHVLGQTKTKIDEIKKKMGELRSQSTRTVGVASQLKNALLAAFSVSAITGYIKKVVEVRAQFELQRVALGAIIQDSERANKMFVEIQQMALQSPFSIMQLERATKNVAAFGFETEKIVPTMKMIADIGAGLGVELERIVLVMGHLKARGYLEGMMVRQFTNMGFNVLGGLAEYYTELEDKMVSVAEVQDRVKKKMVSFADVEEVLKRVTSAGGMFYDMQKKQADSIWGQMQRIKDATDLMLNEIGKSNQDSIKSALELIRTLISHWRAVVPVIKTVGLFLTLYIGRKVWLGIIPAVQMLGRAVLTLLTNITATAAAANALKTSLASTGVGLAVIAISTLAAALMGAYADAQKLNEELSQIGKESLEHMTESLMNYERLANTVRSADSYTERAEALQELQRTYKEILPKYLTEKEYIENNTDAYAAATRQIKEYYQAKEYDKKVEAVTNEEKTDLTKELKSMGQKMIDQGFFDESVTKAMVDGFMDRLADEIMSGETKSSMQAIAKRIQEYFGSYLKSGVASKEYGLFTISTPEFIEHMGSVEASLGKAKEKIDELQFSLSTAATVEEQFAAKAKRDAQDIVDGVQKQVNAINDQARAYFKLKTEYEKLAAKKSWTEEEKERMSYLKDEMTRVSNSFYEMANDVVPGLDRSFLSNINSAYDLEKALDIVAQQAFPTLCANGINALNPVKEEVNLLTQSVNILLQKLGIATKLQGNIGPYRASDAPMMLTPAEQQKWADEKNKQWKDQQDLLKKQEQSRKESNARILQEEARRYGAERALMNENIKIEQQSNDEYARNLRNLAKSKQEIINDWDAGDSRSRSLLGFTQSEIDFMRKEIKLYESVAKIYDPFDEKNKSNKKSGRSEDAQLKTWKEIKKAIEEVNKSYEKYRKMFTEDESTKMIADQYDTMFKKMGVSLDDFYKNGEYDTEALVKALEIFEDKIKGQLNSSGRKSLYDDILKSIESLKVDIKIKAEEDSLKKFKKQVDEMFSNYDLTKTLASVGLSADFTYVVGGMPMTLDDIKKQIEELSKLGKKDSEDKIKVFEDAEKKITEMENKELLERLKNYKSYLAASTSAAVQKQFEYYDKMRVMQKDFEVYRKKLEDKLNDPTTSSADKLKIAKQLEELDNIAADSAKKIKKEFDKELAKINFEDTLNSPLFSEMFQDLGSLSTKVLDQMIAKIKKIREDTSNLSLSQIQKLAQYQEKLENAKIENSPFKEASKAIQEAYSLRRKLVSDVDSDIEGYVGKLITPARANEILAFYQDQYDLLKKQHEEYEYIAKLRERASKVESLDQLKNDGSTYMVEESRNDQGELEYYVRLGKLESDRVKITAEQYRLIKLSNAELKSEGSLLSGNMTTVTQKLNQWKNIVDQFKKAKTATEKVGSALQMVGEVGQTALELVKEGIAAFGKELGEEDEIWLNFVSSVLSMCITLGIAFVALGVQINTSLGIIGLIAMALSLILQLAQAIIGANDARLEKRINNLQDNVDKLERAFSKLKDSIDAAFTSLTMKDTSQAAIANIKKRIEDYYEMINLAEQEKKDKSEEIKEYREKIQDLTDDLEELKETITERWGGFGSEDNMLSAAEEFMDVWLDAFRETGDGLDALSDKWDEYIDNLIKKQLVLRVVGKRLETFFKQVDDYVSEQSAGGEELTWDELYKLNEIKGNIIENLNEDLKKYMNYFGLGTDGESSLSELQKGIQNITEPQAAAIEAYLNSMRFAVFYQNERFDTLVSIVKAQYDTVESSPMLTEVRGIHTVLKDINKRLIETTEYKSGRGLSFKIC